MIVVLASLVPFAIAFWAVSRAIRDARPTRSHLVLRLGLACGAGLALSSAGFSLGLYGYPRAATLVELAIELGALILLWRWRGRGFVPPAGSRPHAMWVWLVAGVAMLATIRYFGEAASLPHGYWDAWASWNLKARFLARATADWHASFDPRLAFTHANYPLLLPSSVARTWKLLGSEDLLVPQLHAFLFTLGTVVVTAGAVSAARGPNAAALAACLVLSGPAIHFGSWQYADVPLSFFLVAAAALLVLANHDAERRGALFFCAGLAAGMAAWTKHEGELFALGLFAACLVTSKRRREALLVAAGAAPWLLLAAWQRHLAPPDDFAQYWSLRTAVAHLEIADRWRLTAAAFGKQLVSFWPLLLLVGLGFATRGGRRSPAAAPIALALLALLSADFLALVTTPLELGWHLSTTVDRLVAQLHAPAVLLAFLWTPGELLLFFVEDRDRA